jgi:roadblock/LC7 domain-containing protein
LFDVVSLVHDLDLEVFYWDRRYGRFEYVGGGSVPYLNPFEAVTAWAVLPRSDGNGLHEVANRKAYTAAIQAEFPHGIAPWAPELDGVLVPYLGEVPDSVAELALEATTHPDRLASSEYVAESFKELTGEDWSWWRDVGRDAFWDGFTYAAAEDGAHPERTSDFEVDRIAAWLGVDTSDSEPQVYTINSSTNMLAMLAHMAADDFPRRAHVKAGRKAWDRWMTEFLDPSSPVAW